MKRLVSLSLLFLQGFLLAQQNDTIFFKDQLTGKERLILIDQKVSVRTTIKRDSTQIKTTVKGEITKYNDDSLWIAPYFSRQDILSYDSDSSLKSETNTFTYYYTSNIDYSEIIGIAKINCSLILTRRQINIKNTLDFTSKLALVTAVAGAPLVALNYNTFKINSGIYLWTAGSGLLLSKIISELNPYTEKFQRRRQKRIRDRTYTFY